MPLALQLPNLMRRLNTAENRRQIARFLVIGGSSAAIDLTVYYLLTDHYAFSAGRAKAVSYLAGVVAGFIGNKYWTFRSSRRSLSEPVVYLLLYAVTLAINVGINAACLAALGDARLLSFLLATGATTVLNFLAMRLVTFRAGIAQRQATSGPPAPHQSFKSKTSAPSRR